MCMDYGDAEILVSTTAVKRVIQVPSYTGHVVCGRWWAGAQEIVDADAVRIVLLDHSHISAPFRHRDVPFP